MQSKLKIKIIKYNKNLFYVVIALNKKSIRARFLDKIGVCFIRQQKKIMMLSLKKLSYWVNKGVKMTKFISNIFSILFLYYLKNKERKYNVIRLSTNYDLQKNVKINKNYKKLNLKKYLKNKQVKL